MKKLISLFFVFSVFVFYNLKGDEKSQSKDSGKSLREDVRTKTETEDLYLKEMSDDLNAIMDKAGNLAIDRKFKAADGKYRKVYNSLKKLQKNLKTKNDIKTFYSLRNRLLRNWSSNSEKAAWRLFFLKEYQLASNMAKYAIRINPSVKKKLREFIKTCDKMPRKQRRKIVTDSKSFTVLKPVTMRYGEERYLPESWSEPEMSTSGRETTFVPSVPTFEVRDLGTQLNIKPVGK